MAGYLAFDTETRIGHIKQLDGTRTIRKAKIHGAESKDPDNDFHTIIYGDHPDRIKLKHSVPGFKRTLPLDVGQQLDKSHTMIGTNLKFDITFIWDDPHFQDFLLRGGKIWDCQLARYLMSGQRHTYPSLAEMQKIYLGIKTKLDRISKLYKANIGADEIINARHRCPRLWKLYKQYGIEDGRTPLLIFKAQYKEAKRRDMLPVIRLYNEYLLSLCMMEHNGIHVDTVKAHEAMKTLTVKMVEALKKAQDAISHVWDNKQLNDLNVNSPDDKSAVLFGGTLKREFRIKTGEFYGPKAQKAGQEKTKLVKKEVVIKGLGLNPHYFSRPAAKAGFHSTDEETINKIYKHCKDKHALEFCKHMKLAATYKKMVNTYVTAFIDRSVDGILRGNFNNCQTITSRLSSSKPNLQNIPSKDPELKKIVQGILGAPNGWTCVQIDFSQLEIYCLAALSQDRKLMEDLHNGVDFHIKRMAYAEDLSYEEAYKLCKVDLNAIYIAKRKAAKTISFQKAYGASAEKLAETTGIALDKVKMIFNKENEEYWGVAVWEKDVVERQVKTNIEVSYKCMLAERDTKPSKDGRRFDGEVELVPIKNKERTGYYYDIHEPREVGQYQTPTGKLYSFETKATVITKGRNEGDIFKYFPPTQMKNYQVQGTAADAQAATSAAMFQFLLRNTDIVRLVNEIHDSKWFMIKNEHLDLTVNKLCGIMSNVRQIFIERFDWDPKVEFKVEAETGPNFADLTEYVTDKKIAA